MILENELLQLALGMAQAVLQGQQLLRLQRKGTVRSTWH